MDAKGVGKATSEKMTRAQTVLLIVLLSMNTLASLDQSIMNVAIDAISSHYSVELAIANWAVLGFSIITGSIIMCAAALFDRFGLKKMMLIACIASFVGSGIGFFAPNFEIFLAARFLQAITSGLCFPIISAAILDFVPEDKKATYLSLNSAIIGIGLAFSPLICGAMETYFGVNSVFLITWVLSAALLPIGHFTIFEVHKPRKRKIDALSIGLGSLGLFLFFYGMNFVTKTLAEGFAFMGAGAVVIALFAIRQNRLEVPLLDLTPFKNISFSIGEIITMMCFMGSLFMSLVAPLYLEGCTGATTLTAGALLVIPIMMYVISTYIGGKIEDRFGIWPLQPIGAVLILGGVIGMCLTAPTLIVVVFLIFGGITYFGVGFVYAPTKSRDLEVFDSDQVNAASSIHSVLAQVVTSLASALFVGTMSSDVAMMAAKHASKADAYGFGFSHTVLIMIGIAAVAFIASIFFSRAMHKRRKS